MITILPMESLSLTAWTRVLYTSTTKRMGSQTTLMGFPSYSVSRSIMLHWWEDTMSMRPLSLMTKSIALWMMHPYLDFKTPSYLLPLQPYHRKYTTASGTLCKPCLTLNLGLILTMGSCSFPLQTKMVSATLSLALPSCNPSLPLLASGGSMYKTSV
jgi:hypothetical protein